MAATLLGTERAAAAADHRRFIAAAFEMRAQALAQGDQPYGAVVVRDDRIVGHGPSRVISRADPDAHAEREAIRAAQAHLGMLDLSGCVLYSTSRPCAACEQAAAAARIARMIHSAGALDAGAPRGAVLGR
jgi:tRNA(adenine34) deaminase